MSYWNITLSTSLRCKEGTDRSIETKIIKTVYLGKHNEGVGSNRTLDLVFSHKLLWACEHCMHTGAGLRVHHYDSVGLHNVEVFILHLLEWKLQSLSNPWYWRWAPHSSVIHACVPSQSWILKILFQGWHGDINMQWAHLHYRKEFECM
jgi:hypothetical protein